ncbi:hypothetical protein BC477_00895 [Clavibacter michiganensis subsp. michiganensis]|uniref:Thymidylate kinase n=1 Tax=Clavibacter michiganensis subsp. michiganensis TaxID=33013 RepID=A0A251XEX4_CLAMM|nr:hypothetical protein BC477_00895 [Clavibacter michiganensis subsp. michiganensis]OUE00867.1 hypothetical protein CMMCAS07_15625 [Clavibacter michiganensis subsp. michiganensis]
MLHADTATLRDRIQHDADLGPSAFRFSRVEPYAEAARTWLHADAEVVDTTRITPAEAADRIAGRSSRERLAPDPRQARSCSVTW